MLYIPAGASTLAGPSSSRIRATRSLSRTIPSRSDFWTASPAVSENGRPFASEPRYIALSTRNRSPIMATLVRSSRKLISPRGLSGVTIISAAITPTPIGSTLASSDTIRSCDPPGAAKCCRLLRSALACWVSMRLCVTMCQLNARPPQSWLNMSRSAHPARSSRARVGRKSKHAWAMSIRCSRSSRTISTSRRRWR